ncbi:ribbon-helix-helix domain-containing protein [Natronomonas sp.]|nr:ribbon-helix-helix domain-containing protein [Natronomonas sp.]
MSTPDDHEEIPVAFDEETLAGIDRLRRKGGYDSRSEMVAAAIDAAGE